MLKLERTSREGLINVTVRDKEFLFTQSFAFAFAIALAIHLGLMILFHVTPFKIGINETVLLPTNVEADPSFNESVVAEVKPTIETISGLPFPPPSHPVVLQHPSFLNFHSIDYYTIESSTHLVFDQIEKEVYRPLFNPLAGAQKQPLEILISGHLAQQELLSTGMNHKEIPPLPVLERDKRRLIFSVMVEGRTGRIFWIEQKQQTNNSLIDRFAKAILYDMRFAINPELVLSGEIELHFNEEEK